MIYREKYGVYEMDKNLENLFNMIGQLEETLENATEIRKGDYAGRYTVDADEILEELNDIRRSIPKDVRAAAVAETQPERILAEAQKKAEQIRNDAINQSNAILKKAHEDADSLLNQTSDLEQKIKETDVYKEAEERSEQITKETIENADLIHEAAHQFADQMCADILEYLEKSIEIVRDNQRELRDPEYRQQKIDEYQEQEQEQKEVKPAPKKRGRPKKEDTAAKE